MSNFKILSKQRNSKNEHYVKENNKVFFIDELNLVVVKDNSNITFGDNEYYYVLKCLKKSRVMNCILGSKECYDEIIKSFNEKIATLNNLNEKEYKDLCESIKKYVLFIKEDVSANIIRKIYDRVVSSKELVKMSPFLAYQIGRNINKDFYVEFIELIEGFIDMTIENKSVELKKNIQDFMEMLIAYYKYYVPNDN